MSKYLTKSVFKNVLDCRTKLFYANNNKYKDNRIDDPFLKAIAEGGFQVGELAKCYYPKGIEIDSSLTFEENFKQTKELLKQKNVVIFEGVLIFEEFLVRFDILVKEGDNIKLIEVKSKSYEGTDYSEFLNKKSGGIKAEWIDNMYDVAYQRWVLLKALPDYKIETYLMLADKSKKTTVDNLNQKFLLTKDSKGNIKVVVNGNVSLKALGEQILTEINIDDVVDIIENHVYTEGKTFEDWLFMLRDSFVKNKKLVTKIGKKCQTCQFTCTPEEEKVGWKNGKKECWINSELVGEENLNKPTVLDIWDYRSKDKKINEGIFLMENLKPSDILSGFDNFEQVSKYFDILDRKLESKERQILQIWKTLTKDNSIYCNIPKLKEEMDSWVYPLHMIDFETTSVAIPFHKGFRPYEGVAFQFSHHMIYEDGRVEHAGEFINTEVGKLPNYEFVRELKRQLDNDKGSIFRYSPHENSYLNMIFIQMWEETEEVIPDKQELLEFIKTITHKSSSEKFYSLEEIETWKGDRDMIDLWDLLKKYYYNPLTNGSNSIKQVLPSILNTSQFIKNKYSQAIYGTDEIKSLNFKNKTWLKFDDDGQIIDPYKQLPYAFEDIDSSIIETFVTAEKISDGGAAMTAYAKIQFTDMSELERQNVIKALLRYCELDTLAMVMLYEHWAELVYGKTYDKKIINIDEPIKVEESIVEPINEISISDLKNNSVKIDVMSLYGSIKDKKFKTKKTKTVKEKIKSTFLNTDNISDINKNLVKMKKQIGKTRIIQTENWIKRFKKDSTTQLMLKVNSNHYNRYQKSIMSEILTARDAKRLYSESVVNRMKKESSEKLKKMIVSKKYSDFEKNVIREVLQVRKVKIK